MQSETGWLELEILTGLQKLSCLSLDRTPAAEILPGTAQAWAEAIADGREWDERRDAQRMRTAFVTLARTMRRWPAPAEFLDALPPVPPPLALAKEHRPASPQQRAAAIEKIRTMLSATVQPIPAARVERDTTPEQRERIEGDLRAHYAGKMTAAGPDA